MEIHLRTTWCRLTYGITQCHPTQANTPALPQPVKAVTRHMGTESVSTVVLDLPTPKGWKAELTWVAGYIPRWFTHPQTVTHPSTNRARRRVTTLIETNALPLCQATSNDNNVYIMAII